MYGTCSLCGEEIFEPQHRDSYRQEVSWLPIRKSAGGPQARQATGAVAHGHCVKDRNSKLKHGIAPSQKGLF
jgi:hypothetical protein